MSITSVTFATLILHVTEGHGLAVRLRVHDDHIIRRGPFFSG